MKTHEARTFSQRELERLAQIFFPELTRADGFAAILEILRAEYRLLTVTP